MFSSELYYYFFIPNYYLNIIGKMMAIKHTKKKSKMEFGLKKFFICSLNGLMDLNGQTCLQQVENDRKIVLKLEWKYFVFTNFIFILYINQIFAGNSNWTQSTLVKECRKAKCVWWQHPENNCPDQLAGVTANQKKCTAKDSCSGTCTSTNCDCVEWYHQVNT